jgi:hypothetical protein
VNEDPPDAAAPTLSILCLAFNHEAFIGQALESFLAQVTRFEVEIVVADDCSTDGTASVVEQFEARAGPRLRLLRSPVNLGVARNLRRALAACRGRYIAFCEGDDHWCGHDKLQTQVDFLEANPAYALTFHDATMFDMDGNRHGVQLPRSLQRDATPAELIATRPISTLTTCFRNVLGPLPPELDQAPALDLCLWSLLGLHGAGKYLPQIEPAMYRLHSGGVFSMQGEHNRYLMTAQSLLCLARLYERQGRRAIGEQLLLKANKFASRRLRLAAKVQLILDLLAWLPLRATQRLREIWRRRSSRLP